MKIRDKRSAYFTIGSASRAVRFMYLDELGETELQNPSTVVFTKEMGTECAINQAIRVDANRPLLVFSGEAYHEQFTVDHVESLKSASVGSKPTGATSPSGSGALIVSGLELGDFVTFTLG